MTEFRNTGTPDEGALKLSDEIASHLSGGEKVLWLIPGGSNIPISVEVMRMVREKLKSAETGKSNEARKSIGNLCVSLTDERFGPVGHPDSNWFQLEQAGFDFSDIETVPVLTGEASLQETVRSWEDRISKVIESTDHIIGQFGIGTDSHIAGILPHSECASSNSGLVCGYDAEKFTRISLNFTALQKIDSAYVFAFSESKRPVIEKLRMGDAELAEQPAQILKRLANSYIYY